MISLDPTWLVKPFAWVIPYFRTFPSVKVASASIVTADTEFIQTDSDAADELWSVDVSMRLYNEGYTQTSIAEAQVELTKDSWWWWPFNRDGHRAVLSGGWSNKNGRPSRMIGLKIPVMEADISFKANFMGIPSTEMWKAISKNQVSYWLWFKPLRHRAIRVKLNKPK